VIKTAHAPLALVIFLILSTGTPSVPSAYGQPVQPAQNDTDASIQYRGYEAVFGVTSRQQTLFVSKGSGSDDTIAIMIGNFASFPQIFLNTPIHLISEEVVKGEKVSHTGYYWKYSYNSFSLDRQDDPDAGGLGGSPDYNYGTRIEGDFFAVTPVFATEMLRPDGTVPFRIEVGLGAGYLNFAGDIVLGDQGGDPSAVKTDIDFSGPALFLFIMGRHQWGSFMFGYQMGTSFAHSPAYGFQHGYLSIDIGYSILF
jgi:hypothetical protein